MWDGPAPVKAAPTSAPPPPLASAAPPAPGLLLMKLSISIVEVYQCFYFCVILYICPAPRPNPVAAKVLYVCCAPNVHIVHFLQENLVKCLNCHIIKFHA